MNYFSTCQKEAIGPIGGLQPKTTTSLRICQPLLIISLVYLSSLPIVVKSQSNANLIKVMTFNIENYENGFWAVGIGSGSGGTGLIQVGSPPSSPRPGTYESLVLVDRSEMNFATIMVGKRVARIIDMIKAEKPAIVCLQEAYYPQAVLLGSLLGYKRYARGRDEDRKEGETVAILYDPSKLEHVAKAGPNGILLPIGGTFWFSSTPDVPDSRPWGGEHSWTEIGRLFNGYNTDELPRICTWMKLSIKETGRKFYVFNLHLSSNGDFPDPELTRMKSVDLLANRIAGRGSNDPVIVTGDFNSKDTSKPIKFMTSPDLDWRGTVWTNPTPLRDTRPAASGGTKCDQSAIPLEAKPSNGRIDYIFVSASATFENGSLVTDFPDKNICLSDHFPVTAQVRIPPPSPNPLCVDVDANGYSDLVFVGDDWGASNGLNVRVKFSNGDETWTSKNQVLGDGRGVHAYPPLTGDVNGDDRTDLIFVGENWGDSNGLNVRVKLSNGDGTWSETSAILGDGHGIFTYPTLTGDVNGDKKIDLIFLGQNWGGSNGLNVRVKLSNGDGTWTPINQVLGDGIKVHTYPTLTGDINGDGKTDLIFVGQDWNNSDGLNVRVKLSNGDGTWTPKSEVLGDGAGVHTNPPLTGDVNEDGRTDLIFVGDNWGNSNGLNVRVMLSNGDGTWNPVRKVLGDGSRVLTNPTLTGDVNGDGKTDLLFIGQDWVSSNGLNIRVKFSNGDGSWTSKSQALGDGPGVHTYKVSVGKVNDDAFDDLIFVGLNWSGDGLNVRVKLSQGDGTWRSISKVFGDGSGVLR